MSHLIHTWKTAAVIRLLRRPIVVVRRSLTLRLRIWKRQKKKKGTKKAIKAAAKMGTISCKAVVKYLLSQRKKAIIYLSQRISKLWVHNLTILEVNWERPAWGRGCHVNPKSESTHEGHGDEVNAMQPQPDSELET